MPKDYTMNTWSLLCIVISLDPSANVARRMRSISRHWPWGNFWGEGMQIIDQSDQDVRRAQTGRGGSWQLPEGAPGRVSRQRHENWNPTVHVSFCFYAVIQFALITKSTELRSVDHIAVNMKSICLMLVKSPWSRLSTFLVNLAGFLSQTLQPASAFVVKLEGEGKSHVAWSDGDHAVWNLRQPSINKALFGTGTSWHVLIFQLMHCVKWGVHRSWY